MDRRINAPEKDWLTIEEVAQWLSMSVGTVRQLIRERRFPRPVALSPRTKRWSALDAAAFAHFAARIPGFSGAAKAKKTSTTTRRRPEPPAS